MTQQLLQQRLDAMQAIGRALAGALELDELLERIMQEVTKLMGAERSTLFLYDKKNKQIWSKVLQGKGSKTSLAEIRLPVGQGIAGWVAANQKIVRIDGPYKDKRFDRSFDKKSGFVTRSIFCAPIFDAKKHLLGVMQVLNKKRGGSFTEEDDHTFTALSGPIAMALENAALYRQVQNKARALELAKVSIERAHFERDLMFTIERQMHSGSDVTGVLDAIISVAMRALNAEAGSISLIDEDTGELYFKSALGEKGEEVKKLRLAPGEGIVGFVTHTGQPIIVNDPTRDDRHHKTTARRLRYAARSIICAPLTDLGQVIGSFELLNKKADSTKAHYLPFTEEDLKLLTLLSGQAARTIGETKRRAARAQEERMKTIGQALAGVIHDFRTPMTVLGGYAQVIAVEEDEPKRQEMAATMVSQVDLMNAMVGELLAFARGENAIYKRKIYLERFVDDVRAMFNSEASRRRIDFNVYLRAQGAAQFDPVKIKRVLANLVRNALEATPSGGKVSINMEGRGSDLAISVKDTGAGVPIEIQHRLFQQFVTAGKKSGNGLGLAVCKRIVEDHGGSIDFQSKPERGTTFTFVLPKAIALGAS